MKDTLEVDSVGLDGLIGLSGVIGENAVRRNLKLVFGLSI